MKLEERQPAERIAVQCFKLRGVLYVPSYGNGAYFAAPGGRFVRRITLIKAGAVECTEHLWPRFRSKQDA
jgi:hypothetical protein